MPTDGLIVIYSTPDPGLAAWLADLLEESGVPSYRMLGGMDGIPAISMGAVETKVMILRSDLEARGEEVRAALTEVEESLRGA
jgi:hypothetical protein